MNRDELTNHPDFLATGAEAYRKITGIVEASGLVTDDTWLHGFSGLINDGWRPSDAVRRLARKAIPK